MIDPLDGQILHALQISPRLSFRRIAAVVGATEQTVARRYHRLRRDGVVRVVGLENPWVDGGADWADWVCRIQARPDRIPQLADGLIRRPDVSHANVLLGWTDLVCTVRAPLGDSGQGGLLQRLPRAGSVTNIDIDAVLHTFGRPPSAPWTGYGHKLSTEQAEHILGLVDRPPSGQPCRPTREDRPMLDALADDGRTPHSRLADVTGWSVARVRRRLTALEAGGALLYDVDVLPERLGYHLSAMLWLTVAPQHTHRVGELVAAHDHVAFAAAVSGKKNLMAVVICRDVRDLHEYLVNQLGAIEEVLSYEVSIRTQRLKQHGSVIAHGRLMNPAPTRAARGSAVG